MYDYRWPFYLRAMFFASRSLSVIVVALTLWPACSACFGDHSRRDPYALQDYYADPILQPKSWWRGGDDIRPATPPSWLYDSADRAERGGFLAGTRLGRCLDSLPSPLKFIAAIIFAVAIELVWRRARYDLAYRL